LLAASSLSSLNGERGQATEPVTALVEIAIPVYNEEEILESSIRRLRTYLDQTFPFSASIVIVDNASVDHTWEVAQRLCREFKGVSAIHLDQKGRGRAIRTAWTASQSEVVAYMDVDLSTDLDGLLPLVAPLLSGHSQVAIGSRIASGSRVLRGGKREFISRTYNLILRSTLHVRFSDAQCGFKAMRRDAVEPLLATIVDQAWFFDTELLIQAERNGLRIHEVSVDWIDDPDTRVNIVTTATEDLKGVWRVARQRSEGIQIGPSRESVDDQSAFHYHHQMARYASVGLLSSAAYLILFLLLKDALGMFAANLVAAAVTATANTLAHISFTFGAGSRSEIRQAVGVGACSFAVGIGFTTAALTIIYLIGRTSMTAEGIAILVGMVAASCVRFVLLREWAFRNHTRTVRSTSDARPAVEEIEETSSAA
jgi:glycosyltransferase involved in cell wall biosynthesis